MIQVKENINLYPFTTLNVGGKAKYFVSVSTEDELKEAVNFAKENALPIFFLGGGSNILVSDDGFDGLVVLKGISGFDYSVENGAAMVTVGSGENWDDVVRRTVELGFAGIECLSGIPGMVGAAPVQNIGAYGQEVSNVIREVRAYDLKTNTFVELSNNECKFGYRKSLFNTYEKGRYVITKVILELVPNGKPTLKYHDLQAKFADNAIPTLSEVRDAVIEIRRSKGAAYVGGELEFKSAGSFFKNPIVSREVFESVKKVMEGMEQPATPWFWDLPNGKVKIAAAYLLEKAGFTKGYKMGKAGISPKHALSLINLGGANAEDIINLAKEVIKGVEDKFGIRLEAEPLMVGFEEDPLI